MTSTNDIRRSFLDHFGKEGHQIVPSAPLVPQNDPTLMFVNAGMVPFKNVFTGLETRPYSTAASSQKCVRAGGKHNDLDNVGYTARHHTFFEMLGNFSFGDYFKERAISLAWSLITEEWGLSPDRLTATVYHTDDEAFALWKNIAGLPESRIIRIPTKDNFWAMGDSGPCGPCSEIFFDHGEHIPGGPPGSPDEDGDRFTEIWNLVFMQFEQEDNEIVRDLPRPSIDTGMGLERIAAVLQGVHDNYDTDTFKALIAASSELTRTRPEGVQKASHRVIADHLRAAGFLIALSYLTKQSALAMVAPLFIYAALMRPRFAAWLVGTVAVLLGGTTLLLNALSEGWYWYYTLEMPRHHALVQHRFLGFWTEDLLRPLPIAAAASVAYLALTASCEPALVQSARFERLHRNWRALVGDDRTAFHERVARPAQRTNLTCDSAARRCVRHHQVHDSSGLGSV
jgi:hypothetical protein